MSYQHIFDPILYPFELLQHMTPNVTCLCIFHFSLCDYNFQITIINKLSSVAIFLTLIS